MNKRRIVFVNCPSPFLTSDKGSPPLGLLYLAAETREAGFECQFVDLTGNAQAARQLGCDPDLFVARGNFWVPELMPLLDRTGDIVALSVTSAQYHSALNLLFALRWEFGDIPVIIGGSHVSALPEEAFEDGFDAVFAGEADMALLDWLYGGMFKGIVYCRAPHDLDALPIPARDLVDLTSYCANLTVGSGLSSTMLMSRGCSFSCTYCVRTLGDAARLLRLRSPRAILDEAHALDNSYGLRRVVAVDDLWGVKRSWLEEFCGMFADEHYLFRVNMRANTLHHDLLGNMYRAGVRVVSFGFESGDDRILHAISKNSVVQNREAVSACHDHGIEAKAYLIFGFPGDDALSAEATKRFVEEAHPDSAQCAWLVPLPGTPLYQQATQLGWQPSYHELYHNGKDRRGGMSRLPWHTDETASLYEDLCQWLEAFYAKPQPRIECPNALSEV